MTRKIVILLLVALSLVSVHRAAAQQPKTVPRIGYLSVLSPSADSTRIEEFRQGLREVGYIDGQIIAIESRYAEGKLDRLADLAGGGGPPKIWVPGFGRDTPTQTPQKV